MTALCRTKLNRRRAWCRILIAVLTVCVLIFSGVASIRTVQAYDEVNKISVTVGFWGSTDYTKKEIRLSELASACGTNREIYTWINAGNSPGTTEAEGVYISDIMDYCNIDMGAIYYYNFYTVDASSYGNANQQWTNSQLFCTRYTYADSFYRVLDDYYSDTSDYMENPERHFTVANIFDYSEHKFSEDAWNDRKTVEPMLALKTRASQWRGFAPASNLDFSSLSSTGKPILMFGQAGRNDITRNLQAQMVSHIHIWFEGAPDIRMESTDMEDEVGNQQVIDLTVSTPDEFLSEQIGREITLRSTDESVATVSQDGTVTFKGEGAAEIIAVYDGKVYGRLNVTGHKGAEAEEPDDENKDDPEKDKDEPEEDPNGSGTGTGTSSGDGDGSSTGANTGEGTGEGAGDNSSSGKGDSSSSASGKKIADNGSSVALTPKGSQPSQTVAEDPSSGHVSKAEKQGSKGGAASGSGKDNIKVYKISEADDQYLESVITSGVSKGLWFGAGGAIALGLILESIYYKGQVSWTRRARKVYESIQSEKIL